ncbi:MAG TPA: cupredoxin domain-containing protein [Stellaceae bacterium]|nr:cupredoxin domain-containing protein [Stellaceae bacterium]
MAFLILALFAACPSLAAPLTPTAQDWSKATVVTVVLTEYNFTPNTLSFTRGLPYRLHLENRGKELHKFTAADFFKAVTLRIPEALILEGREVVLHPGEQKDVYLVPQRPGRYSLICADHDWTGMTGAITIE